MRIYKNLYIKSSKEMPRGVFWIIDGELYAFPFCEDSLDGVAKSGNTYNHEKLWRYVKPSGCSKPYNYYPRGRVDIDSRGRGVIYLNPNIDESFIPEIRIAFGIRGTPVIRYDYSNHYKCFLMTDDGQD